uniref:Uncharacterized protein n=1 Tax=Pyrodinium bahamense TaxID=73915 RepID=A0A7S0ATA6_9DINO|mmetsp:Transcript_4108/g.11408  ORF Transcript_4108/g.11408 Transcript_4108/m.11408 type:complete len:195 (+) Transcript_4108:41-625(+)|eukprot:CAMPEP_0179088058 /NCGR_PEP_ID=MMETSP0796-20121207/40043_1 /TAXON_ID=73915 /ORGANISM="Pyrodinium bahamense, Strain pbaha01" /LENGTH=194 /DNA_ID=CAMNT_0020785575 /DNA_START=40 /DNA_END=624 /DNA_ORIENTATION=-
MGVSCVRAVEPHYDELPERLQDRRGQAKAPREVGHEMVAAGNPHNGQRQSNFEARLEAWALQESWILSQALMLGCVRGGSAAGLGCGGQKGDPSSEMVTQVPQWAPPQPVAPLPPEPSREPRALLPPEPSLQENICKVRPNCLHLCCRSDDDENLTINVMKGEQRNPEEPLLVPLETERDDTSRSKDRTGGRET